MDPPVPYLTVPADIVNQAIDMLGESGKIIGDIADGTNVAETARRNYGQALRQLLRTAHWPFARRRAKLTLLGDNTGSAPPGVSPFVECPWAYAYAWPLDGVQGRFMPWSPPSGQPVSSTGVPLTTGGTAAFGYSMQPARFLVSSSDQYPIETGFTPWNQLPDIQRTEGLGPTFRKIILTNCCNADFVYTRLVTTIEEWDDGFRQAMVTMMAMVIAPVAVEDPKLRLAKLDRLTPILKNTVADARVASANEAGMPQSVDHTPPWITGRNEGGWGGDRFGPVGAGVDGVGYFGCGWESLSWGGNVY